MPLPSWSSLRAATPLPALSRQRLVLLGGGALLLLALLAVQGALEQAATPAPTPPVTATAAATAAGAVPEYSAYATAPAAETPWWLVFSGLALKLVVVLLILYATIWLLRRYLGRPAVAPAAATAMQVLQTIPLDQHGRLHLIEVADRRFLIGATARQISLLADLDARPALGDPRRSAKAAATAPARPFDEHLAAATDEAASLPPPPVARTSPAGTPPTGAPPPPPRRPRPAEVETALRESRAALQQHVATLRQPRNDR